jgi:hypothetical protein
MDYKADARASHNRKGRSIAGDAWRPRAAGGRVPPHSDVAEDRRLIRETVKPEALRASGGRVAKKKMPAITVNIAVGKAEPPGGGMGVGALPMPPTPPMPPAPPMPPSPPIPPRAIPPGLIPGVPQRAAGGRVKKPK